MLMNVCFDARPMDGVIVAGLSEQLR